MTVRRTEFVATALILILITAFDPTSASAARKRRGSHRRSKRAAGPPPDVAHGGTLQERLASLLNGRVANASDTSVKIVEVTSGEVVAERDAHLPLAPASNMKLFTTAAAVDLLHPDFELTTTVYVRGPVDPTGTLDGDVKVVGRGDPTIGGRFHDGHATAVIDDWATDLKRSGVKTIHGDLI